MNVIIIEPHEVSADGQVTLVGRRADHIRDVLNGVAKQSLRVGLLNGNLGTGSIQEISRSEVILKCAFDDAPPEENHLSVILALPRPKVLKRLWAPLASLGVRHLVLTNAAKVERQYFETHWIQEPHFRPRLIEGLEQAGDTRLPAVTVVRRLKPFIEDQLDSQFPDTHRLIAHPTPTHSHEAHPRGQATVLAVGPEGGWTEFELDLLGAHGFLPFSLGPRRLRTDTAVTALIAACRARAS